MLDPDAEIQHTVRQVLAVFATTRAALAVVKHFADHRRQIPERLWQRERTDDVVWRPRRHARVLSMRHTPVYAGAYVDGRTTTRRRPLPGEAPRVKGDSRQVKHDEWLIVLHDHHPGDIRGAQVGCHRAQLDAHRTFDAEPRRGATREGRALFQGIVVCGACGRRMTVRYMADGVRPIYVCAQRHKDCAETTCQFVRGDGMDAAVAQLVFAAMEPAHLPIALEAVEHREAQARAIDHQWQLRLERARYEAELARRRYQTVEPENRWVARSLARDWNEKWTALDQREREDATRAPLAASHVSVAERQRMVALAHDLPTVWHAATTTHVERQQVVRLLLKDVPLPTLATTMRIAGRWQTNACSPLEVERPQRAFDVRRTAAEVSERVRQFARDHPDLQSAERLHQEGYRSGQGGTFSASKVDWLRSAYGIKSGGPLGPAACPTGQRGDGR